MKKINVVFEEDYLDVDILLVPDSVAENLDAHVDAFFQWVRDSKNQEQFLVPYNGKMVLGIATKEFLYWINTQCKSCCPKAIIIKEHTKHCPDYPTAFF